MIEIHLYGKLRRYAGTYSPAQDVILVLDKDANETVETLLRRMGIPIAEINHIFLNSKLLVTRSQFAPLFDLQMIGDPVSGWDLALVVHEGDRFGIFGTDIPLLSM